MIGQVEETGHEIERKREKEKDNGHREWRNKIRNTGFTRVFASGALRACTTRGIYGNSRAGWPLSFLSYAVLGELRLLVWFFYRFLRSLSCSHILPFCTFAISAIALLASAVVTFK